jgi:hypothetical protein
MIDEIPSPPRPGVMVRLGGLTLTGASAVAVVLLVLAGIIALVVWRAPHLRFTPLVASGILWFAFIVYWSIAAVDSGKATSTESKGSRALHQNLLNVGLLLLFVGVPALMPRWVPHGPWPIAAGFALQVAGGVLAVWARRHLGRYWSGGIARQEGHTLVRTGPYE